MTLVSLRTEPVRGMTSTVQPRGSRFSIRSCSHLYIWV